MVIPTRFRTASQPIASYDYEDIASGLGLKKFWLCNDDSLDATSYGLIDYQIYSGVIEAIQVETADKTCNFYTPEFNHPKTVRGTGFLILGYDRNVSDTSTIKVTLAKDNGTIICAEQTKSFSSGASAGVLTFKFECTETLIKQGEKLKLTIAIDEASGTGTWVAIGHDPINRDGTKCAPTSDDSITASYVLIPFKLDL